VRDDQRPFLNRERPSKPAAFGRSEGRVTSCQGGREAAHALAHTGERTAQAPDGANTAEHEAPSCLGDAGAGWDEARVRVLSKAGGEEVGRGGMPRERTLCGAYEVMTRCLDLRDGRERSPSASSAQPPAIREGPADSAQSSGEAGPELSGRDEGGTSMMQQALGGGA
jgi:hypothetical protein